MTDVLAFPARAETHMTRYGRSPAVPLLPAENAAAAAPTPGALDAGKTGARSAKGGASAGGKPPWRGSNRMEQRVGGSERESEAGAVKTGAMLAGGLILPPSSLNGGGSGLASAEQQQQQRSQRQQYLRIMPNGCPTAPRPAHPSLPSRPVTRSASLPCCTPAAVKPPHSLASSTSSSSPLATATPTAVPTRTAAPAAATAAAPAAAAASAAFTHTAPPGPARCSALHRSSSSPSFSPSQACPLPHSPHAQPSPPITLPSRPLLVRQCTAPGQRPNLFSSLGDSPAASPGSSPGGSPRFCPSRASPSYPSAQARPGLGFKRSSLSPKQFEVAASPKQGESVKHPRPRLVRRVSFSSLVHVRRFLECAPDTDTYSSDSNGCYSNAINRDRCNSNSGNSCACSTIRKQQQQQQQAQTSPPVASSPVSSSLPLSPAPSSETPPLLKPHPPPPRARSHSLSSLPSLNAASHPHSPPHARSGMPPSPAARRLIAQLRAAAAAAAAAVAPLGMEPHSPVTAPPTPSPACLPRLLLGA